MAAITFFSSTDFDWLGGDPTEEETLPLSMEEIRSFASLDLRRPSPNEPMAHHNERLAFARRLAFAIGGAEGVDMEEGDVFASRKFTANGIVAKIGRWTDYDRESVYRGWYAEIFT